MSTAETLITGHLDTWSSAIKAKSSAGRGNGKAQEFYGIKKLRELILELAVRGLLMPQDPNDEPALELLKKVEAEESRLVNAEAIRKRKVAPKIKDNEKPFVLPSSWAWIRLAEAGHDWGQKTPESDFTYIDVGSINKEQGLVSNPSVLSADEAPSRARKIVKQGTVIYSTVRPYLLNIAVVNELFDPEPIASTAFAIIHPFTGIEASFVYRYLRSPTFINYVESCQTGIAYPAINDKQFFAGVLPLPPLAEQHRIVAKVDELMALCDQLEQRQEDSVRTHGTLVQTLLGVLTAASERGQFEEAWQRIEANFDTLFTTESSLDQLKQTILQLAVMGKLVVRDQTGGAAPMVSMEKLVGRKNLKNGLSLSPVNGPSDFVCLPLSAMKGDTIDCSFGKPIEIEPDRAKPYLIKEGDVFIIRGNGSKERVGVAGMVRACPPNVLFPDLFIRVPLPPAKIDGNFFLIAWNSYATREKLESLATTTSGIWKVNQGHISECEIPLPPLAEQHRIVAKVDELISLCDRLKGKLATARVTQLNLADSLVETAIH